MAFAHTIWLFAGLVACAIMGFMFYRFQKRRDREIRRFASGRLLEKLTRGVSPGRRMLKRVLLITAVAAIFAALAQPQMGFKWREVKRKGIDILMAVDTSKSMLAEDVTPNRLTRSKLGILDFVSRLEGDRVGLIPFAGTAFLMCPLTMDSRAFKESLDALDTRIIPEGGTDIAAAIEKARGAFSKNANHKILVVVTDGEDLEGGALKAAKAAAKDGMVIYTIGVGTSAGELIPLKPGSGKGFVKDEKGRPVKSRLDEGMLKDIARVTGGLYRPLGQRAEGLDAIYQEKLRLVPKHDLAERMERVPIDRFEWPLLLAILLLIIEFSLSDARHPGRSRSRLSSFPIRRIMGGRHKQAAAGMILVAAFLFISRAGYASPQSAEKAYREGNFTNAMKSYAESVEKAPEESRLQFNLGAAAYKEKAYDTALKAFQASLNTENLKLQNKAFYNMGNTLYREGEKTVKARPPQTIERWEASIKAYDRALKLNPHDEDARFNREWVKKKLDQLKKQQKQNKQQKNKQCNMQNKQQNKNKQRNDQQKNKEDNKQNNQQTAGKENKGEDQKTRKPSDGKNKNKSRENPNAQAKNTKQNTGKGDAEKKPGKDTVSPKQAKNDPTEAGKIGQPADAAKPEKADTSGARAQAGRRPGQMTREEAQRLMDALKGDEKQLSMMAGNRGKAGAPKHEKRRDW